MPLKNLVQDLKDFKRFEQIIHTLFKHGFGYIIEKLKYDYIIKGKLAAKKREKKAGLEPRRIRFVFQELGGAFVKLGQLLSLRPDLIPKEYCNEFSKLQDDVEPFSGAEAKIIVEKELGKKIAYFNKEPIASASIGQVHEAVLRNNEKVVIKVQRPDIKKKIKTDIDLMYKLARLIEKNYPSNIIKPTEIIREFERYTENELDYVKEGDNCNTIYNNFKKSKEVVIPKPYLDFTTSKVLTLEYILGKKIKKVKSKKIAELLANSIFKQVFIDGFFHADPHPGNILVLKNKIALLDFGIVGRLNEELKNNITDLFIAAIKGDIDSIAESLLNIGVIGNIDIESLKEDLRNEFSQYYKSKLNEINFFDVFEKLVNISKKYNIKLPINFILLGKCIMTTESVCCSLDPDFDLVKTSHPFIKKLIKKESSPEAIFNKMLSNFKKFSFFFFKIPKEEKEMMQEMKKVDETIEEVNKDIKDLTEEIEKTSNRRVLGYIISALIISAAITFDYEHKLSVCLFIIAFALFVIFIISLLKEKI